MIWIVKIYIGALPHGIEVFRMMTLFWLRQSLCYAPLQVRLRNAAKARLMRWVKPKSTLLDRNAPEIVKTQWSTGNKNYLADLFSTLTFSEDRYVRLLLESFAPRLPYVKPHVPPFCNHGEIKYPPGCLCEPIEDHSQQEAVGGTYHWRGMVCGVGTQRWTWLVTAMLLVKLSTVKFYGTLNGIHDL